MNQRVVQTGYPSIDKPWLKYYREDKLETTIPECSAYDFLVNSNKNNLDKTAISYFDKKINYNEMLSYINESSKAFRNLDVSEGDIIPVISITTPEIIYSIYALNKLNAIPNMIDPRTSVEGIVDYFEEISNVKIIISLSECADKVLEAASKSNIDIKQLIIISPSNSMPTFKSAIYNLSKKKTKFDNNDIVLTWKNFLKKGKLEDEISCNSRGADCFVIVHTGGTTGTPKSVMISNKNINSSAIQCNTSGFTFDKKHSWLSIMPPFIAYGISNGMHLPLCMGMTLIIIPNFNPNKFDELLIKYKPNHITGVPSHYNSLINSRKLKHMDLSFLLSPIVGGDGVDPSFELEVTKFLREHKCNAGLIKGYGMTEICAAVSASACVEFNKIGSVGIPFTHSCIAIFDEKENEKELKFLETGEICMMSPNVMLGYYNNDIETKNIIRKHKDGSTWLHSGDLGYMDEDGCVFIVGRRKRLIIRHDGFKVFPTLIEKTIASHQSVESCCVVGEKDDNHSQGKNPVAFIQLKDGYGNDSIREIEKKCFDELPEYELPTKYFVIEKIPLTPIGKIDYVNLEKSLI